MTGNAKINKIDVVLILAIMLVLCAELLLNLTPPISRDALIHHLAVPKLWINNGGFYETPWADYSYYPMYINLLYLVCLIFENDIAPKFVHLSFGLGTGYLIWVYLTRRYNHHWGLLGLFIFISTPIVIWLSTSAYIDLGMTFFTTASVLAFISWRNSGYNEIKWLILSAISMGIAIGSKYNALIALLIMNLLLMLCFAKDRKQQGAALKYGFLFFLIAFLAASPWYVKNAILTGNPFYPLFGEVFSVLGMAASDKTSDPEQVVAAGKVSFFHMRNVLYGESFWETLFIPLRMFFQGEDNSYRYFQGVLNPILIVFTPFLFAAGKFRRDHLLFGFISVFFIVLAFFLTRKQVRYLLPVLPLLTILAVAGIRNLTQMLLDSRILSLRFRHGALMRSGVFVIVAVLLSQNLIYLKNRFNLIDPIPHVLGEETREAFLSRHLLHYPVVEYINKTLPDDANIFLMLLGRRGYYLERDYSNEPSFGRDSLNRMVHESVDETGFNEYLRSIGITHIFMWSELVDKHLRDNFSEEEVSRLRTLVTKHWKLMFEQNGHSVWAVRNRFHP